MPAISEDRVRSIRDRDSLVAFLRDDLGWPAPPDLPADELFYDYGADELRLDRATAERVSVRQVANFRDGQPWGVFLLEAANRKLYSTHLRRVLRGLSSKGPSRPSRLPAWPAENLLFIATHDYRQFTFAHFRGERASTARLRSFGWEITDVLRAGTGLRTLCEINLPALHWPEDEADAGAWSNAWDDAFDVEAVTDKFFKDFRDAFEDVKASLPKTLRKPADRHAFAQRLLNRLLFLCFLQKKRWMRGPDLPHPVATYLFDLYDHALSEKKELYSDYLHPLFFRALNRPPTAFDDRERDRLHQRIGYVPFLNGGLFDPTDEWDMPGAVSLPNKLFAPLLGQDGLLRRYNFTVTESTPLNQEVAVDPEMLGKVFETVVLTSEQAEDYQAPNLRKATGSYYTPRIVVTFIVREALKEFLVARVPGLDKPRLSLLMELDAAGGLNDDARRQLRESLAPAEAEAVRGQLAALRACDPAIGSGAFALGMLHEMVNLQLLCETVERGGKDPRLANPNLTFELKKGIIERNLYGADLQAKAVEICKLRLWLSLIVDFQMPDVDLEECTEHQFERAISRIPALPNLSYKIRRGDALLDLVHGQPFRLKEITHSSEMQDEAAALEKAHREFFSAQDPEAKRRLRRDALAHRTRLMRLQLESQRAALLTTGAQLGLFEKKESRAEIRKREAALAEIDAVLAHVAELEAALRPLLSRKRLTPEDDAVLTRLEASGEGEEITFTWELDFPEVFPAVGASGRTLTGAMAAIVNRTPGQMELPARPEAQGGFDLVVGNPPFVTARNETKRKAYAERWKETCFKNYQLVAPFFQRSFGLLRPGGHLGFIVSNAFAKREFGKPLVEHFFPTVELQKIVDCSGLMFPGHGTPTCIVFGRRPSPRPSPIGRGSNSPPPTGEGQGVRVAATLPGGGDLRTPPENSPLWVALQAYHNQPGYSDERIMIADRSREEMAKWPWSLTPDTLVEQSSSRPLCEICAEPIGAQFITGKDDLYVLPPDYVRRARVSRDHIKTYATGEDVRDWAVEPTEVILFPYSDDLEPLEEPLPPALQSHWAPFKRLLESVVISQSTKKRETKLKWFEYRRLSRAKFASQTNIINPQLATHGHFVIADHRTAFKEKAQAIVIAATLGVPDTSPFLAGVLNSSHALYLLKQTSFSRRESSDAESDTYYEFAANKVEQLPIPSAALSPGPLRERLTTLSRECWERGQQLPRLAFRKVFELKGEAYYAWNSALSGWVDPWTSEVGSRMLEWKTPEALTAVREAYAAERERLRAEMVALQEEMDWLVYAAYGLLPLDHPAVGFSNLESPISNLHLGERPFELLRDGKPIPAGFSPERRALWQARLDAIEENEHIRRIEQPVYKRRWYRKESDEQEFRRAFEWWLLEKAEWWLEHKAKGGPVTLDRWAESLWKDERVRAVFVVATFVVATSVADGRLKSPLPTPSQVPAEHTRWFKSIVAESAVPDWIPYAVPWEQVEKKHKKKVPGRAKRIRGKLNVPRERFRVSEDGEYMWAGRRD